MAPLAISNAAARRLLLRLQGLSAPPRRKLTRDGLLALVEELGFVQVDSINTVERAHQMILFARNETYRPRLLTRLLEREARLFENWTHDAAIIPSRFYPYWTARFARERARLRERWRKWRDERYEEMLDEVLRHVRDGGPVMARQMGENGKKNAGGWWDWHPSKTALEFLWRTGELAVCRREGFQKVYDLAERVIPDEHRADEPDDEAFVDWACRGAVARLGFATPGEIAGFWGGLSAEEAAAWCKANLGRHLIEVEIEGSDGARPKRAVAPADLEALLADLPEPPRRLRVLSPFDPLIRDRKRTQQVFGFDYRIEVFVPAAKRRYGYYVFPLLEGERLIGRIDMKHDRATGILGVKGLWLEPGVRPGRGRTAALEAELERLRRFTGAERVEFENGAVEGRTGPGLMPRP